MSGMDEAQAEAAELTRARSEGGTPTNEAELELPQAQLEAIQARVSSLALAKK